jgi:hypothetical protein
MRPSLLIITLLVLALMITPALAADMTIPINKDFREGDMVVHLLQVSITDSSTGNVYSPDPANTVWPKLVFTYENMGNVPINGNLEIAFFDENGKQYPEGKRITDITMSPIGPGNASEVRFLEAAVVPKGTKITHFKIYWEGKATTFTIPYPDTATATAIPAATAGQSTSSGPCAIAVMLPILAIGVFLGGKIKR